MTHQRTVPSNATSLGYTLVDYKRQCENQHKIYHRYPPHYTASLLVLSTPANIQALAGCALSYLL